MLAMPPRAGMPAWPWIAESVTALMPLATRLAQAARSPILGAPPLPVSWHPRQTCLTTCSPDSPALPAEATLAAAGAAGSVNLPPDWLPMNATARATSIGSRSGLPPLAGIPLKPSTECFTSVSKPCLRRALQALASPAFGAPAAPAAWHAAHAAL